MTEYRERFVQKERNILGHRIDQSSDTRKRRLAHTIAAPWQLGSVKFHIRRKSLMPFAINQWTAASIRETEQAQPRLFIRLEGNKPAAITRNVCLNWIHHHPCCAYARKRISAYVFQTSRYLYTFCRDLIKNNIIVNEYAICHYEILCPVEG